MRDADDVQRQIEAERARLEQATRRLRSDVEAAALPRRLPWAIVLAAFAAGLAIGSRLRRRRR